MSKLIKKLNNSRMLKNNGSWLYCDRCDKTVGYLVYSTYQNFKFSFECKCGNSGSFELDYETDREIKTLKESLKLKKNRLCCPIDESPLFTVVEKNIEKYSYSVTCNKCFNRYSNA